MADPENGDGWPGWRRRVLGEIERLSEENAAIRKELGLFAVKIATLEVKAGIWGAVAGIIVVVAQVLITMLTKR